MFHASVRNLGAGRGGFHNHLVSDPPYSSTPSWYNGARNLTSSPVGPPNSTDRLTGLRSHFFLAWIPYHGRLHQGKRESGLKNATFQNCPLWMRLQTRFEML